MAFGPRVATVAWLASVPGEPRALYGGQEPPRRAFVAYRLVCRLVCVPAGIMLQNQPAANL